MAAEFAEAQLLEASGLVRSEKTGRVRTCHVDDASLKLAGDWISKRRAVWEQRFDRLADYLAEEKPKSKRRRKS